MSSQSQGTSTVLAIQLKTQSEQDQAICKALHHGSWCYEVQIPPLNNLSNPNSTLLGQVNACCNHGKGLFIDNDNIKNVKPKIRASSSLPTATATKTSHVPTLSSP